MNSPIVPENTAISVIVGVQVAHDEGRKSLDKEVTTIEGLSKDGLHPVQEAWKEVDVPQCGYCQAGQIMTASAFLAKNASPSSEEIKNAMHGNICRCAAYNRIHKAVEVAATKLV